MDKEKKKEYNRIWRAKNPNYHSEYRKRNHEAEKERLNNWRKANRNKYLEQQKRANAKPKRIIKNREHVKEYYNNNESYKKQTKERARRWNSKHRKTDEVYNHKCKSRRLSYRKIEIEGKKCQLCGCTAVDRHHPNYDKPLEIIFLCKECHSKLHRKWKIE